MAQSLTGLGDISLFFFVCYRTEIIAHVKFCYNEQIFFTCKYCKACFVGCPLGVFDTYKVHFCG